jgi:uncharacterized protein YktA (UPF0223 family)
MNKIIDFLQNQSEDENIPESSIDKNKLNKSFNDIKDAIVSSDFNEKNLFQLKRTPNIKKGQIWLCKQTYFDKLGNEITGKNPYLVLVVNDIDKIANEDFIRVQPISPFTEFLASDEILIEDNSVVGFDFIIETWNEQPILTELLDEFVGRLDIKNLKIDESGLSLSKSQKEFRKAEIRNTAYLRQSINSLIQLEESKKYNTVFINIDNSIYLPKTNKQDHKIINMFNEQEQTYLQAAKKGKLKDRQTFLFEDEKYGIKIKVIQESDGYVISVKQPDNVEIKDIDGNILKQSGPNLYDKVKRGLYFIKTNEKEIRLKLK